MMDRNLIRAFWDCGDDQIIQFAIQRAHLNKNEREIIDLILDRCYTQEKAAEYMDMSVRTVQSIWDSACKKIISQPWVRAYAKELRNLL